MAKQGIEKITATLRKEVKKALAQSRKLENVTTKDIADLLACAGIVVLQSSGRRPYSHNVFYKRHEGSYHINNGEKMNCLVFYADMNKALDQMVGTGEAARRKAPGRRGTAVWKYQFFAPGDADIARAQQAEWDLNAADSQSNVDALKAATGLLERNMIPCAFQKHANGKATLTIDSEEGRDFLALLRKLMA